MNHTKPKILIVDDTPTNIQLAANVLGSQKYDISFTYSGVEALEMIEAQQFDVILLDVMMPEMDGHECCRRIRKHPNYRYVPILFLTARTDEESVIMGFDAGGSDYVTKPFHARELIARVENLIKLKYFEDFQEAKIMETLAEVEKLNLEIVDTQKEVIFTLGAVVEARSNETGKHIKRVAEYSYLLATLYGLQEEEAQLIRLASPMHDIGKIAVPDAILEKPGKLTVEEFEIMKTHAQVGYDMLSMTSRPILNTAALIAGTHHEKFNGTGYPKGLVGEAIPIEGRITAFADVFDALGSNRVYKKAWSDEAIFELFKEERGRHFDPRLVDLFFANLTEFLEVRDTYTDDFKG
jgi:putative two-component system response regulator